MGPSGAGLKGTVTKEKTEEEVFKENRQRKAQRRELMLASRARVGWRYVEFVWRPASPQASFKRPSEIAPSEIGISHLRNRIVKVD